MNRKTLEQKCIERFGRENGQKLYRVMVEISKKDFCVATAWKKNQVSIAKSCKYRGKIFQLSQDYKFILLNNNYVNIRDINYSDLSKYLNKKIDYGEISNCHFDTH